MEIRELADQMNAGFLALNARLDKRDERDLLLAERCRDRHEGLNKEVATIVGEEVGKSKQVGVIALVGTLLTAVAALFISFLRGGQP